MKIKQIMVILLVAATVFFLPMGVVYAATTSGDTVDAIEQLNFSPLIYLTISLAVVMVSSVVLSIIIYRKYLTQQAHICHDYSCASNPKMLMERESPFDYRQFETPEELKYGYVKQLECATDEDSQCPVKGKVNTGLLESGKSDSEKRAKIPVCTTISRNTTFVSEPERAVHVPRHKKAKVASMADTNPMPRITLVPEMKHARRTHVSKVPTVTHSITLPPVIVQNGSEYLGRKTG